MSRNSPLRTPVRLAGVAVLLTCAAASWAATPNPRFESYGPQVESGAAPDPRAVVPGSGALVYDRDYPFIHYSDPPVHNEIARLQKRLENGSLTLTRTPQHGYLESILQALNIDPDSQTLVFSKTSLQIDAISPATPRAIYFDDDTYVAWVQKTGMLEINTMDADRGPVFYTVMAAKSPAVLQRETLRCLTCHDSYSEMGGGVPHFLFESVYDVDGRNLIPDAVARETPDDTPIAQRWGGWYVTGKDGGAMHLGNIQLSPHAAPISLEKARRGSLESLGSLLDTSAYLRPSSDIVALLVLDHQVTVHNQIIHANYKSRTLLYRVQPDADPATLDWSELQPQQQTRLDLIVRPLVDALLMVDAAPLLAKVEGNTGFAARFQRRGPSDAQGRSLRQLDLNTRVFRYPLSYLIYSEGFDALPLCARERVYALLSHILQDSDPGAPYNHISAADRRAAFDILVATKPEFAQAVSTLRG